MSAKPVGVFRVMDAAAQRAADDAKQYKFPDKDGGAQGVARAAVAELIDAADLVASLCSLEWQEPDGSRRGATDNSGKRLWFIGDDLIRALKSALARVDGAT